MLIRDVLEEGGRDFFTLGGEETVETAISLMAEKDAECLIVYEENRPAGIFTERDVLKCYVNSGRKPFTEIRLADAMTNKLIVAQPEDDLATTISMMVQSNIRHIPVIEDRKIAAILFICDLIQYQVGTLSSELHYLEDYVADLQEAVTD